MYINLTENSNSKITSGKKCLNGLQLGGIFM